MKNLWIQPVFLLLLLDPVEIFSCDPIIDCQSSGEGTFVADPKDCEKYYICIDAAGQIVPSSTSFQCDPGMYFDQSQNICALENIPGICNSNLCACTSECPTYIGLVKVAHKNNCSRYYLCTSVGPIETDCLSPTPYFNGQQCVADSSECCDFCTPSCSRPFSQIQDPCDCTSFYLCDDNSMIAAHSSCNSGYYFEESTGTCKVGTCNSLCLSCGSSTSTTTTATITTTLDPNCGSSFTCPSDWDYPRCTVCDPSYWHCTGGIAYLTYCSGTLVFNTDPRYPYCISPTTCPFHPSIFI